VRSRLKLDINSHLSLVGGQPAQMVAERFAVLDSSTR
jgi:hypothetical protein